MSRVKSKMQVKQMPWHANMTEMNHLGAALIAKPEVFSGKMEQLFTAQRYSDNPLSAMLKKAGRTKTIEKSEWEWKMKGANTRPLICVADVSNTEKPGFGRQPFKIKLDENWRITGDIIHPGDMKYQARVQDKPYRDGNGWVYTLRLLNDDANAFLPKKFRTPGQQWGKLYSQYEEAAEQSGSTDYALPMSFTGRLSRFRKEYKVTGDAANEVLAVAIPDSNGKMHTSWIRYAEVEYWKQWYREIERALWYNKRTSTVLGATGRPIFSGSGVQELLEDSHQHHYSTFSATLVEEYLMDIFYSRVAPGSGREIEVYTGEYGMLQFSRAMNSLMEKRGWSVANSNFNPVTKTSSQYNSNAYAIGFQFTEYNMHNGAKLKLVHNPLYDDREINFELDPITGKPKESMRYTFLSLSGESKSNIEIIKKKNEFKLGYVAGLHNPYGPTNKGLMAHSGDYYEMHVQDKVGIHIEDVTSCGELILGRN